MAAMEEARLDHLILPVNDLDSSFAFYCDLLGFTRDGMHGPFSVIRVSEKFVFLLAQFPSDGGMHLAFSFPLPRFEALLARIRSEGIEYGDQFDRTNNRQGPALQPGATEDQMGIYVNDPTRHLIELRCVPD